MSEAVNKQIEVRENEDGRTTIVFKKALLKGKVTSTEVLNTILIAAKLQAEYYVQKMSRGSPLDNQEIKALKDLADIAKIELPEPIVTQPQPTLGSVDAETVKKTLYKALMDTK